MKYYGEILNDPQAKIFFDANNELFNAPTLVYITIPKKGLNIVFLILLL